MGKSGEVGEGHFSLVESNCDEDGRMETDRVRSSVLTIIYETCSSILLIFIFFSSSVAFEYISRAGLERHDAV